MEWIIERNQRMNEGKGNVTIFKDIRNKKLYTVTYGLCRTSGSLLVTEYPRGVFSYPKSLKGCHFRKYFTSIGSR